MTRERERDTLIPLLMIPVERREILAAKWRAALTGWVPFAMTLAVLWVVGLLGHSMPLHYFGPLALWLCSVACLATSLGLFLGAVSRNGLSALLCLIGFVAILSLLPYTLAENVATWLPRSASRFFSPAEAVLALEAAGPWEVWRNLFAPNAAPISNPPNPKIDSLRLSAACISTLCAFLLAALFWVLARRRFEREGKL